jgi:hypothetical protein
MRETIPTYPLTLFILAVSILLLNCRAGNNSLSENQTSFDEVVKAKLGANYTVDDNPDHEYALCQQKRSENDHARRTFAYIVVRRSDNEIVHEGTFALGSAKWVDAKTIEVTTTSSHDQVEVRQINISGKEF